LVGAVVGRVSRGHLVGIGVEFVTGPCRSGLDEVSLHVRLIGEELLEKLHDRVGLTVAGKRSGLAKATKELLVGALHALLHLHQSLG
jgi:hypothetical protein